MTVYRPARIHFEQEHVPEAFYAPSTYRTSNLTLVSSGNTDVGSISPQGSAQVYTVTDSGGLIRLA